MIRALLEAESLIHDIWLTEANDALLGKATWRRSAHSPIVAVITR